MTLTLDPISVQADPGTSPYDAGYLRTIDDGFGNTASFISGTLDGKTNDWYKVALDDDSTYQFTLSANGTQSYNSAQLTIRGFAGQRMEPFYSNKVDGDITMRFIPPKDGLYYLDAGIKGDFYGSLYDPVRYNLSVEGELIEEPEPTPEAGSRYEIIEAGSWTEAQALAESKGGGLVSINSQSEQELLVEQFADEIASSALWIGITDKEEDGEWKWVDGTSPTYENWWLFNAPGFAFPGFDYGFMLEDSARWTGIQNLSSLTKGIAEYPITTTPPTPPTVPEDVAEPPEREEISEPGDTPVPGDGSQPTLPQVGAGTTINIGGDNTGNIIIGNQNSVAGNDLITGNNNVTGSGNYIEDNSVNNGVQITEGRQWSTLRGDETDNIISHEAGLGRMNMRGGAGVDTFVLGDYTRRRKVSVKVLDYNGDEISFDIDTLGIDDSTVAEADNRKEFKQLTRSDVGLIYFRNTFFNNENGAWRGLGGGERFAKIKGPEVALDDLTLTDATVV